MLLLRFSTLMRPIGMRFQNKLPKITRITSYQSQFFSSSKKNIDQQLNNIADNQPNLRQDYSDIANNYIQLQQKSFLQYAKQNKNDPQMMLMLLSTFQDSEKIKQFLVFLYPHVDYFQSKELLLFLQKVLVFMPSQKPKIPFPKPLEGIQSILVVMSQIYEADKLIQWLNLVPIYKGKDYYILCMGYFSILQKMSPELKNRNRGLLIKCHKKICEVLLDQQQEMQIRAGIISLSFQLNYGQAILLLLQKQIKYTQLDPYKTCLLFINVSKYMINKKRKPFQQEQQIQKSKADETIRLNGMVEKQLNKLAQTIVSLQFVQFMKIQILLQIISIVKEQKQLKGQLVKVFNKCLNLLIHKKFVKSMKQLEIGELLLIFQTMEKHKINNEKIIKVLLVLISPHLYNMTKLELITLTKCLVTYVRQCQDYLINVRKVLQERKMEFNEKQAIKINQTLRRVQVLFPRRFSIK